MKVACTSQGTSEWFQAKLGMISASRMCDVLATLKRGGESAARAGYRMELISERLTQLTTEHYVSPEMQWGIDTEPMARAAYEIATDQETDRTGFVIHPTIDHAGASVDGLVGDDGIIEIKCAKTTTHLRWMMAGEVPDEHRAQMVWGMACTERKWADFISFDPRLPGPLQLFVKRLKRDEKEVAAMEYAVIEFDAEIQAAIDKMGQFAIPQREQLKAKLREAIDAEGYLSEEDIAWAKAGFK